jgi:RNA polymerase-binding transcription factor DksA
MSGYGRPDEEQENAQALVDNAVGLVRMMIPKGPSAKFCGDCGEPIPEARRQAAPGIALPVNPIMTSYPM